jgi:cell division protein FtsZ
MKKREHKTLRRQSVQKTPPRAPIAHVKVIGIGGAGGKIISRMMEGDRMRGVEFIAINTDAQDLDRVMAHKKIYIGRALTKGLGAGMNPEIGKQAAEENRSEIGEALEGADVVFVTAGMGGGTGTLGASVVAEVAKEKGILTVAMVTKPFAFEGAQRSSIAQDGLHRIKDKVDSLIIIPNDRIFSLIDKETSIVKAFGFVDEILKQAVLAVTEVVNVPGIINVDFADVKAILRDAGTTLIGIGMSAGQERSVKAVNGAIRSPLVEISIDGAKGVLFTVAGGKDLKMSEINDIAKAVTSNLDPNAKVIFGAYYDKTLKDKSLKVTVVATGFNGVVSASRLTPTLFFSSGEKVSDVPDILSKKEKQQERGEDRQHATKEKEKEPKAALDQEEPWEIPAFLRKKKK